MPTIYDNREHILSRGINEALVSSKRADFCIGYFNLRGWKEIADSIESLSGDTILEGNGINQIEQKRYCRLLIGMQKAPLETLLEHYLHDDDFQIDNGNPPYISLNKIPYHLNIEDFKCSDVYAYIIHRGFQLLNRRSRYGFIVMHNFAFSRGFLDARKYLISNSGNAWFSFYARIPAGLFSGDVRVRNCIYLLENNKDTTKYNYFTTRIHRWFSESRDFLFVKLNYSYFVYTDIIPMFNSHILADFFQTMRGKKLELYENKLSANKLFYKKSAYNWIAVSDKPAPCYNSHGKKIPQSKVGGISLKNTEIAKITLLYLSGKMFLSFWLTYGDEFDVTKDNLFSINTPFDYINANDKNNLLSLADDFLNNLDNTIQYKLNAGKKVGTYNTSKLWYITDKSDKIFLEYLCKNSIEIFEAIEDHISSTVLTKNEELEEYEE